MDSHAWYNLTAAVEKSGTKQHSNAIVQRDLTGMALTVSSASMDKVGMKMKKNAPVEREPNGMDIFV